MKTIEPKDGAVLDDVIQLRGCYEIALLDALSGKVLEYQKINNVVVTAGRSWVLQRIYTTTGNATAVITAIAVGTSTAAPATSDTALGSEILRLSVASFDSTLLTANPPSWNAQVTFGTAQANTTLGEAGLFNATSAGVATLLSHVTFATINKQNTNTLAITYTLSN